jgi:hypothetical protein
MALDKIFARSPYFVTIDGAINDVVRLELFIWNDPNSSPLAPNKILSKTIVTGAEASFNIAPYIREYIDVQPLGIISANYPASEYSLYCKCYAVAYVNNTYDSNTGTLRCIDGYGNFEQGMNPNNGDFSLARDTYYYYSGSYGYNGTLTFLTDTNGWYVKYIETDTLDETTVSLGSAGFKTIERTIYTTLGNTVEIYNNLDEVVCDYVFLPRDECKYTPIAVDFINKWGAPQREIFYKASYKNFDVNSTSFKAMPSEVNYDPTKAINKIMNVNGKESIRVNTDWVPESYALTLQEMLLSESINISEIVGASYYPVKLKTNSIEMHKHINQKLINYTLEFEYAFDKMNNII